MEHRVAELDDGYTRTANTLEAVMLSGLTQHQLLIVMAVWRKTCGYNKNRWIGSRTLRELTGMAPANVLPPKRAYQNGVLTFRWGVGLGMNKNISEWKTKVNGFGKTFTRSVKLTFTQIGKNQFTESVKHKRQYTKGAINTNTLTPNGGGNGQVKPERRKAERIDYESFLNAYNAVGDELPHAVAVNETETPPEENHPST